MCGLEEFSVGGGKMFAWEYTEGVHEGGGVAYV